MKHMEKQPIIMIVIGILGMAMALTTYPIYKKILNSRKKKYAAKIVELSNRIMKG